MPAPYFLFFDVDADRELKISMSAASAYMSLPEGRPARLRKCKVMVEVFGKARWFLVVARYDENGERNKAIQETTGFCWWGPLAIMKLGRKRSRLPTGMTSSRDFHAATSALERYALRDIWIRVVDHPPRYLEEMARQLSRTDETEWRSCIDEPEDDPCPMSSRVVEGA